MFILKKKKKRKKIIVLGRKKIPLTWLSEHTFLVALVFSKIAASIGILGTEVISLIIFIMIYMTWRSGLQAQAASLWQENKPRGARSDPKEKGWDHICQYNIHLHLLQLHFLICKMGSRAHLSYPKDFGGHALCTLSWWVLGSSPHQGSLHPLHSFLSSSGSLTMTSPASQAAAPWTPVWEWRWQSELLLSPELPPGLFFLHIVLFCSMNAVLK